MVSTNTPVTTVNLDDVCESKTNTTLNYLNMHKLQTDDVTMKPHVRISHTLTYTTDEAAAMFRLIYVIANGQLPYLQWKWGGTTSPRKNVVASLPETKEKCKVLFLQNKAHMTSKIIILCLNTVP